MLRFFRQIRQNLLARNRFSRYLVYAVGEIMLVVVGILIALQVNNWNEERKTGQVELSLLEELKADLEYSKKELQQVSDINKEYLEGYRLIHSYIEEDRAYNSLLDSAFANLDLWSQPYLSTMTYETMKTKGIDLIQNDSLKKQIVEVYNLHIQSLIDDMVEWEWSFSQNTTQRMMVQNVRRSIDSPYVARPNDFERLKKDDEFRNFLSILIVVRNDNVDYTTWTREAIEDLIRQIDKELQSRKSD
jgi:hypothetical protein